MTLKLGESVFDISEAAQCNFLQQVNATVCMCMMHILIVYSGKKNLNLLHALSLPDLIGVLFDRLFVPGMCMAV